MAFKATMSLIANCSCELIIVRKRVNIYEVIRSSVKCSWLPDAETESDHISDILCNSKWNLQQFNSVSWWCNDWPIHYARSYWATRHKNAWQSYCLPRVAPTMIPCIHYLHLNGCHDNVNVADLPWVHSLKINNKDYFNFSFYRNVFRKCFDSQVLSVERQNLFPPCFSLPFQYGV